MWSVRYGLFSAPPAGPLAALLASLLYAGCGPLEGSYADTGRSSHGARWGLASGNGLTSNGLTSNGLTSNGLGAYGLATTGLASEEFSTWFEEDPALHDEVMRYVVRCAVPPGMARTYTSPLTGQVYTWVGALGLTPGWASGAPAQRVEQQVLTACLVAHTNPYGVNVPISLLGLDARGLPLPVSASELSTYSQTEACFFGNLFTGEGLYAGNDRSTLSSAQSTLRRCALSKLLSGTDALCLPVTRAGRCEELGCTLEPGGRYYTRCTYHGVSYQPLNTRLRPADVYRCGDGVCQLSERCGDSTTAESCRLDCGACPG